jgi:hypothetical protein
MSAHAVPTPPDEPKTPLWLPAVGAALFILVGLWWAMTPSAVPVVVEEAAAPPSATAPAQQPAAAPSGHADDAKIRQLLDQMRQNQKK